MNKLLSVIIPAYNEEAMIPQTAATIAGILEKEQITYELIFVDDGSSDLTWTLIRKASEENHHIRGISFSRNFGKDPAIFAGLGQACGDCCVIIDCDLQHPPEKIVEMYRLWEQGYEIVEGVKRDRGKESAFHALFAKFFYSLISRATGIDMQRASDFKLLDRKAVDALLALKEPEAFFRALSSWIGFKSTKIEFEVRERTAGKSKWSLSALIRYALSSITSFSAAPMQFATAAGFFFLLLFLAAIIVHAVSGANAGAWLFFLGALELLACGCLLLSLGIIGYYIAKIYRQVVGRPQYIIADKCGGQQ